MSRLFLLCQLGEFQHQLRGGVNDRFAHRFFFQRVETAITEVQSAGGVTALKRGQDAQR